MNDLKNFLDILNVGVWVVDLCSVLILFNVCKFTKQMNSSFITMVMILIAGFFMLGFQMAIEMYQGPKPKYNPYVNFVWYTGYLVFYVVTIKYIRKAHDFAKINIGTMGKYFNNALLILGVLQIAQYTEILLFKQDSFVDPFYRFGIPLVNISTTIACFYMSIFAYYNLVVKKRNGAVMKWNI